MLTDFQIASLVMWLVILRLCDHQALVEPEYVGNFQVQWRLCLHKTLDANPLGHSLSLYFWG
jgi:hypothetical protein